MSKDNCPICDGKGYLPVPDKVDTRMRCKCTLQILYHNKLGSEVFNAKTLQSSEYANLVTKNLFITATRRDFLPHLRFSLIEQGLGYFSRVTNDSQMLDAWLSKSREHSQEAGTAGAKDFTSLRDLVQDPELVVLFLGIVAYSNRALPGILLEALRTRSFEGKPTWVVNPHAHPFNEGHYCYSPEVEEYLALNFVQKKIAPSVKTTSLHQGIMMKETEVTDAQGNRVKRKKIDLSKLGM